MFIISAPHPALQTTVVLPSPQLGDTDAIADSIITQEGMDGTLYTTIKRPGRDKLRWDFILTRNKALELAMFYKAYAAYAVRVVDHDSVIRIGYMTINPFEGRSEEAAFPALQDWPRGERCSVSIEFEGVEA